MADHLIFYTILTIFGLLVYRFTGLAWVSVNTTFSIDQLPAQMFCIQSAYGKVDPSFEFESEKIIRSLKLFMVYRLRIRMFLFSFILIAGISYLSSFTKISSLAMSISVLIFFLYVGAFLYHQKKLLTRARDYGRK